MDNLTQQILFQSSIEDDKLSQLKRLYPNCFTKNGEFIADKFKQIIQEANIPISQENYSLQWLGKSYAKALEKLSPETLLAEDTNHNTKAENIESQNLLIKGDNLEVLKHLRKAYSEQVKMIYIDPPYNTGSDGFVYQDDRKFTAEQLAALGNMDLEAAQRVLDFTSKKSSSHSAWLTFMYPRLYIARELLREDGVIFISIDDNEQAQLKLLCDEVFGEGNFINQILVKTKVAGVSGSHLGNSLQNNAEYTLIYCKNKLNFSIDTPPVKKQELNSFIETMLLDGKSWKYTSVIKNIDDGEYVKSIKAGNGDEIRIFEHKNYETCSINDIAQNEFAGDKNKAYYKYIDSIFRTTNAQSSIRTKVMEETKEFGSLISIEYTPTKGKNAGKKTRLYYKDEIRNLVTFLKDVTIEEKGYIYKLDNKGNFWDDINYNNLANEAGLSYPNGQKPVQIIKDMAKMFDDSEAIIMDFFAGSGTTGHSVMQLNAENNGNRKFILVQIPEDLDVAYKTANSEAKKGIKNLIDFLDSIDKPHFISEITQARLEKSAIKIREEFPDCQADLGFKIFATVPDFRPPIADDAQTELYPIQQFSDGEIHTLLTTWRLYDGQALTDTVQSVSLDGYTAYLCGETLYLLDGSFDSVHIKALIEMLDDTVNHRDFVPKRIVLHGDLIESSKQKELAQAVQTYANKKDIHISLIARV